MCSFFPAPSLERAQRLRCMAAHKMGEEVGPAGGETGVHAASPRVISRHKQPVFKLYRIQAKNRKLTFTHRPVKQKKQKKTENLQGNRLRYMPNKPNTCNIQFPVLKYKSKIAKCNFFSFFALMLPQSLNSMALNSYGTYVPHCFC